MDRKGALGKDRDSCFGTRPAISRPCDRSRLKVHGRGWTAILRERCAELVQTAGEQIWLIHGRPRSRTFSAKAANR